MSPDESEVSQMPKTVPCLWFDGQAEEAAKHYVSIFPNSTIDGVAHYGPDTPGTEGEVMLVSFTLDGQEYSGLNGGPMFTFSEAVSFQIFVEDQAELDHYWERLTDGGEEGPCGWLKDRFGVSWQIVPTLFRDLLDDPDEARGHRAMQAVLKMGRPNIAEIQRAADGVPA
jgi:predicted 3-demethylubiquinone-9 3-methyltransferase (glyoxalase superfamily)